MGILAARFVARSLVPDMRFKVLVRLASFARGTGPGYISTINLGPSHL